MQQIERILYILPERILTGCGVSLCCIFANNFSFSSGDKLHSSSILLSLKRVHVHYSGGQYTHHLTSLLS